MKLLDLDEPHCRDHYDRQPFKLRHHLSGHEAFTLPALRALALRLPRADVLHRHGKVPFDTDFDGSHIEHANGLTLEETFDRIQEVSGYVVLNIPERDPTFRVLVDQVLAQLRAFDPGLYWFATYIFISAGGAMTPYHMDRELNFLLHMRGRKEVSLWDPADREVMTELERERLFGDFTAPRPKWREALKAKEQRFELNAGEGVHHPFIAPHLVRTSSELAVSWAITFRTTRTDARAAVHKVNHKLRRFGIDPSPQGRVPAIDLLKASSVRLYRFLTRSPERRSPYLVPHRTTAM